MRRTAALNYSAMRREHLQIPLPSMQVDHRDRGEQIVRGSFGRAGDSVPGTTLLPVPLAGYWSNRSDVSLVHYIHACPRGEVCIGGLANASEGVLEGEEGVALPECWLPKNLTSDACTDDAILWCVIGVLRDVRLV